MKKNLDAFSVYKDTNLSKIILLCDHASNYIPKKYKNLGLKLSDVNKHIGWDIGALKVAKKELRFPYTVWVGELFLSII